MGASSARIWRLVNGLQLQVPHKLLCDRRVERQSYPRDFATKQINYASRSSIPVQEYQEHSSLHSWPLQQQLPINHSLNRGHTNKRILRLFNFNSGSILLLRPGIFRARLSSIKRQPSILHRPSGFHRKINMTIHRSVHSTIKPRSNLIILRKSRISNLLLDKRIFAKSRAEMVLRTKEFGTGEGGAGESMGKCFRRMFCAFDECCLGFCCT